MSLKSQGRKLSNGYSTVKERVQGEDCSGSAEAVQLHFSHADSCPEEDCAINEITTITGQKAVATYSKKDIANFKLRKKMPIGVMVTLRRERMYEFLEKLVRVALPRIRDFKGIESKFDGRGNYTLGVQEQIIFPEINIDTVDRIQGMNITFVTSAKTDEEGYALLKAFGLPFKNAKND